MLCCGLHNIGKWCCFIHTLIYHTCKLPSSISYMDMRWSDENPFKILYAREKGMPYIFTHLIMYLIQSNSFECALFFEYSIGMCAICCCIIFMQWQKTHTQSTHSMNHRDGNLRVELFSWWHLILALFIECMSVCVCVCDHVMALTKVHVT